MSNVLIIGGSSGIGLSTVERLVKDGFNVCVLDRNPVIGDRLTELLDLIIADILDESSLEDALAKLSSRYKFDHLVITAGGAHKEEVYLIKHEKGFWNLAFPALLETFHLNLIYQIKIVSKFVGMLSDTPNKSITLTSSINSMGRYGLVAYSTAKAGLEGFVKASAEDLGGLKVRINCVSPGSTKTPLTISEGMDFEKVRDQTLLDRINYPADIADTIHFLIQSNALTGQCLVCDSGQSLRSLRRY